MALALFDLDNTLLADDSDHAWGQYLVDHAWVSAQDHQRSNDYFYGQYQNGVLDIHEYVQFVTGAIQSIPASKRIGVRDQFVDTVIRHRLARGAADLLANHKQQGHTLVIITATIDFITRPIADLLGVEHLIATEAEREGPGQNPEFTGRILGTPAFQEGKVKRLNAWCQARNMDLAGQETWFYSDSHNDLPLLQAVTRPFAVDPDEHLRTFAEKHSWPVISLRH